MGTTPREDGVDDEALVAAEGLDVPAAPEVPVEAVDADNAVPSIADGEGSLLQMTALTMPTATEVLEDPIMKEMAEQIESADYYHVFEVANAIAVRYMVERVITKLPEDKRKAAEMVVTYVNYSNVPQGEKSAFLQLAAAYQTVSRIVMTNMLGETAEEAEAKGFTVLEAAELKGDAELAGIMDDMFIKWQGMRHACSEEKRAELGFTSRWHMTVEDGQDGYMEAPIQDFMPKEYNDANFVIGHLIDELNELKGNPKVDQKLLALKLDFYENLGKAMNTTDVKEVDSAWEATERTFVRQANAPGNRIVSTHSQEWGYAGNSSGIGPELTVKVIVPNHPSDLAKAEALRDVKEKLPSLLVGMPKALSGIDSIGMEGVTTVYPAIQSGAQLDFESAGQNLPNHFNVRDDEGVVSNMSPNVLMKRLKEAGETLFVNFLPKELLAKVDYNEALADIARHEMGHNIGDRTPFREGRDVQGCEEWKASGTEYALAHLNAESLSDDALIGFVVSQVAQGMRYAQKRNEASQYPYYLSYLSFVREAQNAGILQCGEDGQWSFDGDRAKLMQYIDTVKDQWVELEGIYESADQAKHDAFIAKHFTDFIPDMDGMEAVDGSRIMDEATGKPMPSLMADVAQFLHRKEK